MHGHRRVAKHRGRFGLRDNMKCTVHYRCMRELLKAILDLQRRLATAHITERIVTFILVKMQSMVKCNQWCYCTNRRDLICLRQYSQAYSWKAHRNTDKISYINLNKKLKYTLP